MSVRHPHRPDPGTAERLVAGCLDPDDAPPGYRRVAALLQTAGAPPGPEGASNGDITAMAAAIRAMDDTTPSPSRRRSMLSAAILAKAIAALSAVTLSGSAAAAATGHLPGSLQDKVANVAEHVGVNIPGGDDVDAADHGKGSEISDIATTTPETGVDKGAEISGIASDGKSRAGEDHGAPASNPAGVETPNGGGAGTAATASDGASSSGAGQANPAAGEGSDNAEGVDDLPTGADDRPAVDGPATASDHSGGRN